MIFIEVAFYLGHHYFDFQSWSRRRQFSSHFFDFQRLYRYTISPMEYEGPVGRRKNTIGLSSDLRNRVGQPVVTPDLINVFIHPAEGKRQIQVISHININYLLSYQLHKKMEISITEANESFLRKSQHFYILIISILIRYLNTNLKTAC